MSTPKANNSLMVLAYRHGPYTDLYKAVSVPGLWFYNETFVFTILFRAFVFETCKYSKFPHERSETVINNNIIEIINTFIYQDCPISYQNEKVSTVQISKFLL